MQSKSNALKRKGARPGSRSTRSGIRWDLYQDGHHIAYVRGREGAYELTAMEHPAFMDGKGWAVFVERARDNTSSSMDSERIAEKKGSGSGMGSDPATFVMKKAEELFLENDQFVNNITAQEYRRWNELHPGRDGYRTSDWVIYARKRGSKSVFMPFTPYGYTTRKDDTIHAMRVGPENESSVVRFLDGQADNPDWEFEARSGPEGPNERRMRASVQPEPKASPKSKSVRAGVDMEQLAADMVRFVMEYDTYGFADEYDDFESAFIDTLQSISSKKGIKDALMFLDEQDDDDFAYPELMGLYNSIRRRLKVLERSYDGSASPKTKPRGTRR